MQQNEIDGYFKKIGEFGLYQGLVFVLVGTTSFIPAMLAYSMVFIGGTPEHRCRIPGYLNDTFKAVDENHTILINDYIPRREEDGAYDRCNLLVAKNGSKKYECSEWVYSDEYFDRTITTDWNLFCGKAGIKSTFSSLYFAGSYALLLIGFVSDRFGRKKCAYIFMIFNTLFSILVAILTNVDMSLDLKKTLYSVLYFLTGVTSNLYSVCVVLAIEITGPKYRIIAANCIYYFYIIGEYLLALISYLLRDYKKIYICLAVIMSIFPLFFWIVPESPRWLFTKGKRREAMSIFKRIARVNRRQLPENILLEKSQASEVTEDKSEMLEKPAPKPLSFGQTFVKICKSRKLLVKTIAILFNWLTNNLVYYGISLGSSQLAGNPYLNFCLLATNEFLAIILSSIVFGKFGRKIPYTIAMCVSGVALLAIFLLPKSLSIMVTIMVLIGKFTISFTYSGIYIITTETYPTVIRNTSITMCQCFARLGAIISPSINLLGQRIWSPLPYMIFGSFAAISTLLTVLFIPETKNQKLPDSLDDDN